LTLAPLLASPATVVFHAFAATVALLLGATVLFLRKGTALHKALGSVWAATMMVVAGVSLGMTGIDPGHFSAIHLLSVLTIVTIPYAIWMRRRGNILGHAWAMSSNYVGLLIAGAFTFAPGRVMHAVLFG
jgi:uncharacterized membrane protein